MHNEKRTVRNIKMVMMYDGSKYKGFQRLLGEQNQNMNTIQGMIEDSLSKMLNEEIKIIGSGRTDTGVHAYHQVANFHTNSEEDCSEIKLKLNEDLPEDLVVFQMEEVDVGFHSRYDAKLKTYEYHIDTSEVMNVFTRKYAYHYPKRLDVDKMNEAAEFLIGEHDFSAFSSKMNDSRSTIRKIYKLQVKNNNNEIKILISGNGFLYNMVRIIVGTLLLVGDGSLPVSEVKNILESRSRINAGPTLSSHGLFLKKVDY